MIEKYILNTQKIHKNWRIIIIIDKTRNVIECTINKGYIGCVNEGCVISVIKLTQHIAIKLVEREVNILGQNILSIQIGL